jgi:predicted nucleic acid-binding protein
MKPTIMMTKVALDTNILLYAHNKQENKKKYGIATNLLGSSPIISGQVVSEYLNVSKRLLKHFNKIEILDFCVEKMSECTIHPVELSTIRLAKHFIQRYDFQLFDGIIVASAVEAGCEVLYSEDMQHRLNVNRQLTIINPFI